MASAGPSPAFSQPFTVPQSLMTDSATHQALLNQHNLLHLLHARNRNQHRRSQWYRHFGTLRHELRRLCTELGLLEAVRGGRGGPAVRRAPDAGTGKTERRRMRAREAGVARRLAFWRDAGLVEKWYLAFTHVIRTTQFSVLGLSLLAILARVSKLTGLTAAYESLAEDQEQAQQDAVRAELERFAAEEMIDQNGVDFGGTQGAGVDVGEVVERR